MVWQVECSFRRRGCRGGGCSGGGGTAADGDQAAPLSGELGAGYVYNVSLIRGLVRKGTTTRQAQAQSAAAAGGACKLPPALSTLCPEVAGDKELGGQEMGISRGLGVYLDQGDKAVASHCVDAAAGTLCQTEIGCAPELCLANSKLSVVQYI